jgi:dihydroxy-acid dehydratase
VKLSEKEIAERLAKVPAFKPKITGGYLSRYVEKVTSASHGAVLA